MKQQEGKMKFTSLLISIINNKVPFTSIAEELLQCLKEKLITELIIMTSYRKDKHPPGGNVNKRRKKHLVNFLTVNFIQ